MEQPVPHPRPGVLFDQFPYDKALQLIGRQAALTIRWEDVPP
jgi:hypothetical protein